MYLAGTCNPSKLKADIWGWLEVRRSAMLHYKVNHRPHWASQQYGHSGGTWGWLGVERCQLCLQDTSWSAKWHLRAAVGHWVSFWVRCCRMVGTGQCTKMATISNQLAIIVRPSFDHRLWWYRLQGGNIKMYIPGKQVNDCKKFIFIVHVPL